MCDGETYRLPMRSSIARWVVAVVTIVVMASCAPSQQDYADADRIRQQTADEAAAAAQRRQAEAVEIEAAQRALPARVARDAMLQGAIGLAGALGLMVLLVGGAAAVVAWLNVRASVVYPNRAGQYPVVVKHNGVTGQTLVYDPSRAVGPVAVISAPNIVQQRLLGSGESVAALPIGTDHETQARITTQAQAANVIVAATRNGAESSDRMMTQRVVSAAFSSGGLPLAVPEPVVLEPGRARHIERLLEGPAGSDDD